MNLVFDHSGDVRLEHDRIGKTLGTRIVMHPLDQFAGQILAQFRVEQMRKQAEQFVGPIVVAAALGVSAEILDHRLQRAELSLHLMRQPRVVGGARRFFSWRRLNNRCLLFVHRRRQSAGHVDAARGRHLDLSRTRQQPKPSAAADFPRVQHGRVGAQFSTHQRQRRVHRRRSISSEFHGRGQGSGVGGQGLGIRD